MPDKSNLPKAPPLLNDDGTASMATAFMSSHHGFRRDIAQFGIALRRVAAGDHARVGAVRDEWQRYRTTLHGHHQVEDTAIFPSTKEQHPELAAVIDGLFADHHKMDPMLEEGDRAFAELPATVDAAAGIVSRLSALLDAHLATEETHVVPLLRDAKAFPPPASEAELAMYAQGFAWSSHGIAPDILDKLYGMLPETVVAKLPAARAAFEKRCEDAWGSSAAGASRTPIPDWL
jgi:hemerythrin-like domain-containing protein